jgi:hypothetical protein
MDVEGGNKAAKSIGKSKANRQAQLAQKRGLQESGKASNSQVKKQTLKAGGGGGAANAAKNAKKNTGGMKISFQPSLLKSTTALDVQKQILGVLSKAPKAGSGGSSFQSRPPKSASRTVVAAGGGGGRSNFTQKKSSKRR